VTSACELSWPHSVEDPSAARGGNAIPQNANIAQYYLLLVQPGRALLHGLPHNSVIFSMRPDPEPIDSFFDISSQCSVMFADADGPKFAEPFEVQGRVTRIGLEESKILVS
jgi:hypothetical protein